MTQQVFVGVDVAKDWLDIHHPSDSGRRSGPRSIGGGRPVVRTILYLAALQASRRSATFSRFRDRLQAAGKSIKAAIIATARKLVITLNAMLASGTDFRPMPAD